MTILDINELAEILKLSRFQVDKLVDEGLPSMLVSLANVSRDKRRFILEDVLEWLKGREQSRK